MPYATRSALASWLRIDGSVDNDELDLVLDQATAAVDAYCGRSFASAAGSATARVFRATWPDVVYVDDISSTTDLVVAVDTSDDGTFNQTWTTADYQLEPLNQIQAGLTDHPYYRIRAVRAYEFPVSGRATVQVTARWGWTTVPPAIEQATLLHAGRLHSRRVSAAGIAEGQAFPTRVSFGLDADVAAVLGPYRRVDRMAAV